MAVMNNKQSGFTLIELMIGITISGVVIATAYTLFDSQQKAHISQQEVVDVQQGLRAGMEYLVHEIRLAGYDECRGDKVGAGISIAEGARLGFTMSLYNGVDDDGDGIVDDWDEAGNIAFNGVDDDGDGVVDGYEEYETLGVVPDLSQPDENVIYGFFPGEDADLDGIADDGAARFGRTDGSNRFEPLIENVHALAFAYAFDDDDDGFLDQNGGNIIWAVDTNDDQWLDAEMGGAPLVSTVNVEKIRAVRIWLLARTSRQFTDFLDARTYAVGDTLITPNDGFMRRLLTTAVLCKNMG